MWTVKPKASLPHSAANQLRILTVTKWETKDAQILCASTRCSSCCLFSHLFVSDVTVCCWLDKSCREAVCLIRSVPLQLIQLVKTSEQMLGLTKGLCWAKTSNGKWEETSSTGLTARLSVFSLSLDHSTAHCPSHFAVFNASTLLQSFIAKDWQVQALHCSECDAFDWFKHWKIGFWSIGQTLVILNYITSGTNISPLPQFLHFNVFLFTVPLTSKTYRK